MESPTQNLTNRTFMCAVVFIDIVEYSKKPVAQQVTIKNRFNAIVAKGLENTPASDRIILDTGDGAALCFLGDPEDGVFVTNSLRNDFAAEPPDAGLQVRIGINLGPVKVIRDLNGNPNIVGDGINVAQRVMSFAKPNQILVSRSYYEVVSRLTQEYSQLFRFIGAREDKHVREHELYEVAVGGAAQDTAAAPTAETTPAAPERPAPTPQPALAVEPVAPPLPSPPPAPKSRTGLYIGLAAVAAFVVGVGAVTMLDDRPAGPKTVQPSPAPVPQKQAQAVIPEPPAPQPQPRPRPQPQAQPATPQYAPQPAPQAAPQVASTGVFVNGRQFTPQQLQKHQQIYGHVPPGYYWYDRVSGLYGNMGQQAAGYIHTGHDYGVLPVNASNGNTGIYLNGRHLNTAEVTYWQNLFRQVIQPGRYWLDGNSGNVGVEGNSTPTGNVRAAIQAAMARYRR